MNASTVHVKTEERVTTNQVDTAAAVLLGGLEKIATKVRARKIEQCLVFL